MSRPEYRIPGQIKTGKLSSSSGPGKTDFPEAKELFVEKLICHDPRTKHLMESEMALSVLPATGAGAEITGVDISRRLSESEMTVIKNAFAEHGAIFFREQNLTEAEHITFARRFGEININRFFAKHRDYPEIAMVSKEPDQVANIGGGWHTDHSYDQEPAMGSILIARELPPSGGDTWFANMYKAYETLPVDLKASIRDLRAIHSARHVFGSRDDMDMLKKTRGRIGNPEAADALHDSEHPVVISHPLSKKKALYVNPGFTIGIAGWSERDSESLLGKLYKHAIKEEHITKYQWKPGSIAFWDNRATWHFAQNDYQGFRRIMHRITINGCPLESAFADTKKAS